MQRELEELWRGKLGQAWARYEGAQAKCLVLSQERQEGMTPSPDGAHALRKAQHEESAARREYMRVLHIVNDFVVHGCVLPEE